METTGGIKETVLDGSARDSYAVRVGLTPGTSKEDLVGLLEPDDTIVEVENFDMYRVEANGATLRRLFSNEPRIVEFIEPARKDDSLATSGGMCN